MNSSVHKSRILPNFLVVGAQKAGTTSLYDILGQHPEICMSEVKEINFFTLPHKLEKGPDFYNNFFKNCKDAKAIGECSPGYLCYPDVYKYIEEHLGTIKIVIILRDPIKRAYSQYWDNRRQLKEPLSEVEIIEAYLEEDYHPARKGYFSRGVYFKYIYNYIKTFGREKVKVIIFEDLIKNQKEGLQSLYRFLEVDTDKGLQSLPKPSNASVIYNNPFYKFLLKHSKAVKYIPARLRKVFFFGKTVSYKYKLPEKQYIDKLKAFYKPWNIKLKELLDIELKYWH